MTISLHLKIIYSYIYFRGGIVFGSLIKEYMDRMTKEDVTKFAKKNGITLDEQELDIVYKYSKEHWRTVYYGNPKPVLDELKGKLKADTYNEVEMLYSQLKNKLS